MSISYTTPIAQALHRYYLSLWTKPHEERIARLQSINTPPEVLKALVSEPRTTSEQNMICHLVQQIEQCSDSQVKLRLQAALRRRGVRWSELVEQYGPPA